MARTAHEYRHNRWRVEWTTEPTDINEDIIDPQFFASEAEAMKDARSYVGNPDVVFTDVAKVRRRGCEADGETAREYHYKLRIYCDGREVPLTSNADLLGPVEVR